MPHRRHQLIQAYQRVLASCSQGAPLTKRNYARVMHQITDDLTRLNQLPPRWEQLSRSQLMALLAYWRSQGQHVTTIANKLSILRGYFKRAHHANHFPSNASLGLTWSAPTGVLLAPAQVITRLYHPWIKSIVTFEWQFGLTCRESILLLANCVTTENHLRIYSDDAHNHQGRLIPIERSTQRDAIAVRLHLLQNKLNLTHLAPFSDLKALYRAELRVLGIKTEPHFRRAYVKERYHTLCQQGKTPQVALQQIETECGIKSKKRLSAWVA